MRALIINVASAVDRMAWQRSQMAALGLEWERLEAVTPATLPPRLLTAKWQRWQRPLKATELALFLSHRRAWKRVRAAGRPHLIIEDDAQLATDTPGFLHRIEHESGFEHLTLQTHNRKKLIGRPHPYLPVCRLYQDRNGSVAYVLWPEGAKKLLARTATQPAPADAAISATWRMSSWQAEPALAIDPTLAVDMGSHAPFKVPPPSFPPGTILDGSALPGQMRVLHRTRRIAAQLRMGLRHLSKIAVARRRMIALADDWPEIRA